MAGADFFTTEVWTWRGLVTYDTVFVSDLASRRVPIVGSRLHPDDLVMQQVGRTLSVADYGLLRYHHVLICDRHRKWTADLRRLLGDTRLRVVPTPFQAPNANSSARSMSRSDNPIGARHFSRGWRGVLSCISSR